MGLKVAAPAAGAVVRAHSSATMIGLPSRIGRAYEYCSASSSPEGGYMRGRTVATGLAIAGIAGAAYFAGVSQNAATVRPRRRRAEGRPVEDLHARCSSEGALHRPDAHDHAEHAGVEGLRAGDVRADDQPGRPGSRTRTPRTASRRRTYTIATDQFGTQLDPPAHWAPEYAGDRRAAGDVRGAAAGRDLDRRRRSRRSPKYALQVSDIQAWEKKHGRIPEGSVVMVRSDWSKKWTDDPVKAKALAADPVFPGVVARRDQVPAAQAPHPVPRPRAAGHGHDADARGRVVADAPRLHAGRGRRQPRQGAGDGLPGRHRLPEVQGRPRRLRALHRDLPARTPRTARDLAAPTRR